MACCGIVLIRNPHAGSLALCSDKDGRHDDNEGLANAMQGSCAWPSGRGESGRNGLVHEYLGFWTALALAEVGWLHEQQSPGVLARGWIGEGVLLAVTLSADDEDAQCFLLPAQSKGHIALSRSE